MCREPASRSAPHRGRFTISAAFRPNCSASSIPRRVTLSLPAASSNCWRPCRSLSTTPGGSITATWSVLVHAYPKADIPVVQLSINESQPASFHFELGKKLAPLRDEGILIVGSGNLVHNLHTYAWGRHMPEPYDWAIKFELEARQMMLDGDFKPLVAYEKLGKAAMLSIPTPDHYLPLLYVVATRQPGENITFPVEGVDGGSISMLSVRVGSGKAI